MGGSNSSLNWRLSLGAEIPILAAEIQKWMLFFESRSGSQFEDVSKFPEMGRDGCTFN